MSEAGRELDHQNVAGRMRESAQAMRQGSRPATESREPASRIDPDELARALDKVADRLGARRRAATGKPRGCPISCRARRNCAIV